MILQKYFRVVTDKRQEKKVKHNLLEIIVMTISAWANEQQLVLGELAVEEKSNEITAVPQLLDMLDVASCIVTADAISCQKEITKKIIEKNAEYVLSLKENQPTLCHEVREYFSEAVKEAKVYPEMERYKTLDCGHGRMKKRTYYLSTGRASGDLEWYARKWNAMVTGSVKRFSQISFQTLTGMKSASKGGGLQVLHVHVLLVAP